MKPTALLLMLGLAGCSCSFQAGLVKTCAPLIPCPIGKHPDGIIVTTTCKVKPHERITAD